MMCVGISAEAIDINRRECRRFFFFVVVVGEGFSIHWHWMKRPVSCDASAELIYLHAGTGRVCCLHICPFMRTASERETLIVFM